MACQSTLGTAACFATTAEHFLKWHPESADVIIAREGEDALNVSSRFQTLNRLPQGGLLQGRRGPESCQSLFQADRLLRRSQFGDVELRAISHPSPLCLLLREAAYRRRCTFCVHYRRRGLLSHARSGLHDRNAQEFRLIKASAILPLSNESDFPHPFQAAGRGHHASENRHLNIRPHRRLRWNSHRRFWPTSPLPGANTCSGAWKAAARGFEPRGTRDQCSGSVPVLKQAHAAGIANHVFMICGFPTESEDEYAETIQFLDENKEYIAAVHRRTFSVLEPETRSSRT